MIDKVGQEHFSPISFHVFSPFALEEFFFILLMQYDER